ncbi:hypothetical protein BC332_34755 [Capsicum chinense]|nr:hypothetical protein BC332_34755 [Capsicum chinense]
MRSLIRQRFNITFCFNLGIPCAETFGQESVEDEEHGNRPSTATDICHVEEERAKLLQNGLFELAEQANISKGSAQTILIDYVDMHRVSGTLAP